MRVRTMRKYMAGPGMKLALTCCQANRIRVGMRTIRKAIVMCSIELLTVCQANEIRVEVGTVSGHQLDPVWHHSHTVKPTGPE